LSAHVTGDLPPRLTVGIGSLVAMYAQFLADLVPRFGATLSCQTLGRMLRCAYGINAGFGKDL